MAMKSGGTTDEMTEEMITDGMITEETITAETITAETITAETITDEMIDTTTGGATVRMIAGTRDAMTDAPKDGTGMTGTLRRSVIVTSSICRMECSLRQEATKSNGARRGRQTCIWLTSHSHRHSHRLQSSLRNFRSWQSLTTSNMTRRRESATSRR